MRRTVDCRDMPGESGCTLTMSGEPAELLEAAVLHAVAVHGHEDSLELREAIRSGMHDEQASIAA